MTKRKDYQLTDAGVKSIAKQSPPSKITRHGDGNNLYLIQHPNGSLFWQMAYRYQSNKDLKPKQKNLSDRYIQTSQARYRFLLQTRSIVKTSTIGT
ncbi:Arm DNA-binding domain-containing protein [Psychrobacter sp. JCM 18900]|uniref:Arm DNA-binding domain-containing protein n=1 Tax=Psychrobacter sp. JCM 18900 TaxID=1298608 RepID=UPI0021C4845B|nr:Arm DNA-binding domain-containing protein [Psychrobacter sp. JCM 18900]